MINEEFIRKRITELRLSKGISEYKMSIDLGHSKGYVQGISSGRSLPSISELLYICEYFNITPSQFFNNEIKYPELTQKAIDGLIQLNEQDISLVLNIIDRMTN